MLLGDLIARFDDEAVAEEAVLALGDLAMLAALRERAAAAGLPVGACPASGAGRQAGCQMGKAPDPGAVYLRRALAHACSAAAGV